MAARAPGEARPGGRRVPDGGAPGPSPGRLASTQSRLAGVLERLGQIDDAARAHDAAVLDPAGGAGAYLERARFRARRGDLGGAREDLAQAKRLEPPP